MSTEAGDAPPHTADPELCLIGALLYLMPADVAAILALVADDDPSDPRARLALGLIRSVVAAGDRPDPTVVSAEAANTGGYSATHLHRLRLYLADAYTAVPHPGNAVAYAKTVVATAFRRRAGEFGTQVHEHADAGTTTDLLHVLRAGPDVLRAHYGRLTALGDVVLGCDHHAPPALHIARDPAVSRT